MYDAEEKTTLYTAPHLYIFLCYRMSAFRPPPLPRASAFQQTWSCKRCTVNSKFTRAEFREHLTLNHQADVVMKFNPFSQRWEDKVVTLYGKQLANRRKCISVKRLRKNESDFFSQTGPNLLTTSTSTTSSHEDEWDEEMVQLPELSYIPTPIQLSHGQRGGEEAALSERDNEPQTIENNNIKINPAWAKNSKILTGETQGCKLLRLMESGRQKSSENGQCQRQLPTRDYPKPQDGPVNDVTNSFLQNPDSAGVSDYRGTMQLEKRMTSSANLNVSELTNGQLSQISMQDIDLIRNVVDEIDQSGLQNRKLLIQTITDNHPGTELYKLNLIIETAAQTQNLFKSRINRINCELSNPASSITRKLFMLGEIIENACKL